MEKGRSYVRITGSGLFFFLRNLLLLKIVLACAAFPAAPRPPHTYALKDCKKVFESCLGHLEHG